MQEKLAPNQLDILRPILMKAFSVLGFAIESRPTFDEIKTAYRREALLNHPDKGGDENKMKAIVAAYELLIGKTKLKIPEPQRPAYGVMPWICSGGYVYSGTASVGTVYECW